MITANSKQNIIYSKKILAFIDILGFEELVCERYRDNPDRIYHLLSTLRQQAKRLNKITLKTLQVDPKLYDYHMFSDTITISHPYYTHDDFVALATVLMNSQYVLWFEKRIFIRGAVVYNDIYEENEIVFGPAVVRAYHFERDKDKAVWPRILVDQSIIDILNDEERNNDFTDFLRKDENGLVYLDYLRDLFHIFAVREYKGRIPNISGPLELLQDHKARIEEAILSIKKRNYSPERESHLLRKFVSLSNYHNSVLSEHCGTISQLTKDRNLILNILKDLLNTYRLGTDYQSKYTAESSEYWGIMTLLGIVMKQVMNDYEKMFIKSTNQEEDINRMCDELCKHLHQLDRKLRGFTISLGTVF